MSDQSLYESDVTDDDNESLKKKKKKQHKHGQEDVFESAEQVSCNHRCGRGDGGSPPKPANLPGKWATCLIPIPTHKFWENDD